MSSLRAYVEWVSNPPSRAKRGKMVLKAAFSALRKPLAVACLALTATTGSAVSDAIDARAHVDAIPICLESDDGMPGLLSTARGLGWQALANNDYGDCAHLIHEIEWIFALSHDPYSGKNANVEVALQMANIIAQNRAGAEQYLSTADPEELFGGPTRRLLAHPEVDDAIMVVFLPGDYGAAATCIVVSSGPAPENFLSIFSGLEELPPSNRFLTMMELRGRTAAATETLPASATLIRELKRDFLAAYTDYDMHFRHSFEIRIFPKKDDG